MATDKSEPRTKLIFLLGGGAIVTLIFVHAGLVSYFDKITTDEVHKKVGAAKPEALMSLRADEKARLTSGSMPIEQAMQKLSTQGRMGASPDIMPTASKDVSPEQGWAKMPQEIPPALLAPPPPPPVVAADAGASPLAADAGTGKPGGPGPKPAAPKKKP